VLGLTPLPRRSLSPFLFFSQELPGLSLYAFFSFSQLRSIKPFLLLLRRGVIFLRHHLTLAVISWWHFLLFFEPYGIVRRPYFSFLEFILECHVLPTFFSPPLTCGALFMFFVTMIFSPNFAGRLFFCILFRPGFLVVLCLPEPIFSFNRFANWLLLSLEPFFGFLLQLLWFFWLYFILGGPWSSSFFFE